MHELIILAGQTIGALGYPGIFLLMAMESSVIPIPSELVMPPAGYLAQQGQMNMALVILCGTAGKPRGRLRELLCRALSRQAACFSSTASTSGSRRRSSRRWSGIFKDHGEVSTFIGRLLPVVRHLISLPAGLAGMNHVKFSLYTLARRGLWVTVLSYIGYFIGANRELIMQYSHQALIGAVALSVAIIVVYIWNHRRKKRVSIDNMR